MGGGDDTGSRLRQDREVRRFAIFALGSLVLLFAACGSSGASPPKPTSAPTFAVAGPDPTRGMRQPRVDGDVVVAAKRGPFRVFTAPSSLGNVRPYRSVNDWGQPLWLPAIGDRDVTGRLWFHVLLPDRPNGSTGWVRARDVDTSSVQDRIVVRLHEHTLIRYRDGDPVARYVVAVGKASTPTTPGRFFVWARVGYADTEGPYGNFALGLSGFSRVITDWPGGGRMAIHGTGDASIAGEEVSNGCVRLFNPLMSKLIDVPMGARVIIRP
jgi:L,D-transpeptidase catalytic domain